MRNFADRKYQTDKEDNMTPQCFKRHFQSNTDFQNTETFAYMDSLAYTVQEFFYTEQAEDDYRNYNMGTHIHLYDLMSVVAYFIGASTDDFGKASIKGYIQVMKQSKYARQIYEEVEYVKKDGLLISKASSELILTTLWAAYIYDLFRYALATEREKEADTWKQAAHMLYDFMKEEAYLADSAFKKTYLVKKLNDAEDLILSHVMKNNADASQQENTHTSQMMDVQLQSIIDEQKEQIEQLKAENVIIPQLRHKVAELEKQLSEKQSDEEMIEIPRQKIRIEMLNLLFSELGFDTAWITDNRKKSAVARVYASILGTNNVKGIKDDVGKATYVERPPELAKEIEATNKLLQDINNDWKIDL